MQSRLLYVLTLSLSAISLIGCAANPPYQAPTNAPLAFISSGIPPTYSRNDSISIDIHLDDPKQVSTLYYIDNTTVRPDEKIAIEANKPLKFSFNEAISDRFCYIEVEATLKPNKNYRFIGGTTFEKSIIPFLPNRGCEFAIKEVGTGNIVSYKPKK